MTLHLRITKAPDGAPLSQSQQTFDQSGGSVGRGPDNAWVLPDPERILSSRHCEFVFEGGQYQLLDLSTNGTFINGSPEPLGKGTRATLNNGDEIEVGDYCFTVELAGAEAPLSASPFEADPFPPQSHEAPFATADDPFGSDPFAVPDPVSLNGGPDVVDPLQALDQAHSRSDAYAGNASPWGADPEPSPVAPSDDYAQGGNIDPWSQPMAEPAMPDSGPGAEAIAWPESHPENLIPDDWLDDDLGASQPVAPEPEPIAQPQIPMPGQRRAAAPSRERVPPEAPVPPPKARIPEPAPVMPEPSAPVPEPSARAPEPAAPVTPQSPAQAQSHTATPRAAATERMAAMESAATMERAAAPERSAATESGAAPQAGATAHSSAAGDLLIEAMGLDGHRLSQAEMVELYPLVGRLVREVISGLMQVLRSRASIKNEFRMNVTTIQPVENNPLKFSADVDEALENLFLRRSQAYQAPLEAVHEGFQEIAEHQLAMIAGMRSAFEHMLQDFDPERLEQRFDKQQKRNPISALQQRRYWRQYQEYYEGLNDNIERSFQQVFGDEFVQAYQDQLRRLSASRSS